MNRRLDPGLYDSLLTVDLAERCRAAVAEGLDADLLDVPIDRLAELVSRSVSEWVTRELDATKTEDRVVVIDRLATLLIVELEKGTRAGDEIVSPPRLLRSVSTGAMASPPDSPITPLSVTTLLTNARGEPSVGTEIDHELESADSVDILVAFVRFTGIRGRRIAALRKVIERGGSVRVLTTTYTGSTEQRALDELAAIGAEVKVSYNTQSTRLHAKAWLFGRRSGFTTGLVGSSNLTHTAQTEGREWNIRVSSVTTPDVVERIGTTFETYWHDPEFEPYDPAVFAERTAWERPPDQLDITHLELRPYAFQQEILDHLEVERRDFDRWRNLVVAATGTGKTVLAALDYRRLRDQLKPTSRLLFVAHRREILRQSRSTFRAALRQGDFGELWLGDEKPAAWDHVFASIQTINAAQLDHLPPDHFDMVIVDEFHHAAAPSYKSLLDRLQPQVLLGLTATPERTDGGDITHWFDGRFAAELRLWDALERGLLAPFHYFGIHDDVDLSGLNWSGGRYATSELNNLYTGDHARVAKILESLRTVVADPSGMRALGFCVSVEHARFMAEQFTLAGLNSVVVSGETPTPERDRAIRRLQSGELQAIFSRDVFNEGVDIPAVDTVLLLRPTESATVYLQQLGRGLRKSEGKDVLTVLDFIGQQRKEYRFDQQFRRLLKGSRTDVISQIEHDFPFLPAGCHIELDRVSKQIVIDNIKAALPNRWKEKVAELQALAATTGGEVSLSEYLKGTGLEIGDVYRSGKGWTALRRAAGMLTDTPAGADEDKLQRAVGRMLHVDDASRIRTWQSALSRQQPPRIEDETAPTQRLLYQLHALLWGTSASTVAEGFDRLWSNPAIVDELREALGELDDARRQIQQPIDLATDKANPLQTHARYSRDEVLAAFGLGWPTKLPQLREGVKWLEDVETDLFFVTLQKGEEYSPTTRYRDYAISPDLFHWESQSVTSTESKTGQRYVNQRETGSNVVLFARERKTVDGTTAPYTCLGLAEYVQHEGDRPIAITYKLHTPMSPGFFSQAKAVAV